MSMSNEAFQALQEYQSVKTEVQGVLDAVATESGLSALIASSTGLALALEVLRKSIKNRKKYAAFEGSDSGHAARVKAEDAALQLLNKAAADKQAKDLKAAQEAANAKAKQEKAIADLKQPEAFPTLAQAAQIQPKNKTYVPPPKQPFKWGPPK